MKLKAVSGLMLTLLLTGMLFASFRISETCADPTVRFYVKMPDGYIPGAASGELVTVEVWIDSPSDASIVAWTLSLQWDPTVLEIGYVIPFPPPGVTYDVVEGNFLKDWCDGYPEPCSTIFDPGDINKTAGTVAGTSCVIDIWEELPPGTGADGSGCLVYYYFTSKSAIDYSPLHLLDCEYGTTAGTWPVDIVEDGHYNAPPNPAPDLCIDAVVLVYAVPPIIPLPCIIHIYPQPDPSVLVYKINATVTNQGTADAGSFNVSFSAFLGGEEVPDLRRTNTTMGLEQGGAKSILFDFEPQEYGNYTLIITADCDNDVPELDETNNVKVTWVIGTVGGDLDGDGDVDFTDFWLFVAYYPSDPAANPLADLDWDGDVDFTDFWKFLGNYPTI